MEQIEKVQPVTHAVSGHRVIVSDEVFSEIINVLNKAVEVLNELVDKHNEDHEAIVNLDSSIKELANAVRNL